MSAGHKDGRYLKNRRVVLQGNPICYWCKRAPATQADHIIELDRGGGNELENLVPACAKCNNKRAHLYSSAKAMQKNTARAEALRDNGIEIKKTKTVFYTQTQLPPTQSFSIPNDQPEPAGIGRAWPRLETVTADHVGSFGADVAEWSTQHLNIDLMGWQRRVLDGQLAFDDNGDLLHRYSLVSTARQNGKTVALAALVGWWLTSMGAIRDKPQTVLSTAHRLDLAVMLYDYLAPILQKRFNAKLMSSYGRNSVTMPDGSRWFIRAANNSVGHGMSANLIVADECWDIGRDVVDGGLLPAQRAQQSPLLSMWSTAGTEASTAMLRWREQGLRQIDKAESSSLYFAEWSPPPEMSPMNPDAWAYANPALGTTLDMKTIEAESENPDRVSFLRASCNLWVASDKSWIQPGVWSQLRHDDPLPAGGVVAVESSLVDERYFGVKCVVLPDRRTVATVAFVCDTYDQMLQEIADIGKDPTIKFAIAPSIDIHWPVALERRRIVVGYAEILKFTPRIRSMIHEKLLWHTGETMLAEHVQRAVAVRSQNSIALSSQRSPGPIELARCLVWASALASRPTTTGRPMIVVAGN